MTDKFYYHVTKFAKYITHNKQEALIPFPFKSYKIAKLCELCKSKLKLDQKQSFSNSLNLLEIEVCQQCKPTIY